MRSVCILLLIAAPAQAQRAQCGYGDALAALAGAEREAGQGAADGLLEGRDRAARVLAALERAAAGLHGCGCGRAAELAEEAAQAAAHGPGESSAARVAAALGQARVRAGLARERLGRQGCA